MSEMKPSYRRVLAGKAKNVALSTPLQQLSMRRAVQAVVLVGFIMFGLGAFLLFTALPIRHWQNAVGVAIPWVICLVAVLGVFIIRRGRPGQGLGLTIAFFLAGCLAEVLLITGYGVILAIVGFVISSGLALYAMPPKFAGRVTMIAAFVGAAILVLDFYPLFERQASRQTSFWVVLAISVVAVIVSLGLVLSRFRSFNIGPKLITFFVMTILLAITAMAIVNGLIIRNALTEAANRALDIGASQTALAVDDFLRTTSYTTRNEASLLGFSAYLTLSPELRKGSRAEKEATTLLFNLKNQASGQVASYILMDLNGKVLLETWNVDPNTYPPFLGLDKVDPTSFSLMLSSGYTYVSPLLYSAGDRTYYLYFASRVTGSENLPIGILVVRYYGDVLQSLLASKYGLAGEGSYPILFDEEGICLAHGLDFKLIGTTVQPLELAKAQALQAQGRLPVEPLETLFGDYPALAEGLMRGDSGRPFFSAVVPGNNTELHSGAVHNLGMRSWQLAYVQPQSVFLAPVTQQVRWTALLALVLAALTTTTVTIAARFLTQPIVQLTDVARRVSGGDLNAQAVVGTEDEIGALALAFNTMTNELRQTLEGLEHRVAERTADLTRASEQMQRRANQLQAVAEAARAIASIQNPEELLQTVTRIVSERFNFYHVGIFMLDKTQEYAVLQAANSEGGQRMLARGHRLKKGQGIVGYVVAHGEPRIALDVGADAVFFDNPDLPYTRSEMALPLRVGNRVIGALDVQSIQQSAFAEEDLPVLSTLADQISIAIENARLFSETRNALSELQALHAQYLQEAWSQASELTRHLGYEYQSGKIRPLDAPPPPELWQIAQISEPTVLVTPPEETPAQPQTPRTSLLAPIMVRGQVIGLFNLSDPEEGQAWGEEEISFIRTVADQVGLALENARLLEQTQRRAEREHLVTEITSKLRASNNPQTILQTAVDELRQALRARHAQIILEPVLPEDASPLPQADGGNGRPAGAQNPSGNDNQPTQQTDP